MGEFKMRKMPLQTAALGLAICAGAISSAQEKPAEKTLSPEAFLELRSLQDPQFSPDGTRITYVLTEPWTGEKRARHIWLYDLRTHSTRQLTYSTKSESFPRWSPDGTKLAFLSDRGTEQQIYSLRMDGGEAIALTKGNAGVISFAWSPDGQTIALLAPDPKTEAQEKREKDKDDAKVVDKDQKPARLRLLDLKKMEDRALTPAGWRIEEVEWLPNGQRLLVRATNQPYSDEYTDRIYSVSAKDGKSEELFAPHGPFNSLRVSPDGKLVSFIGCRQDGPSPHDLMLVRLDGGGARNLSGASLDRQILDFRWLKDGSIIAVYAEGFHNLFVKYTADGERKEFPGMPVNAGQLSVSASEEVAFLGETATTMQELWVLDGKGATQQLSRHNQEWKVYPLVAPEYYRYKSFDGEEVEAALLRPAGYDKRVKLPAVVLVHGGPTGKWNDSIEIWGQLLAAKGYVVLYPNIRGSIGYGQKFMEMNRADWGGGDYKDVMAGVEDLVAKGIADPDRLGIAGWSYGGYMAEWAVTQTTRFKAAVSGAGMANLISEFGTETAPAYDQWFWGSPYERPEGFLNSSPFLFVKNAKTPTLILQGEADTVDPLGQSQELYRGLKHYGVETELVVFPREPHGFQEAKHRVDMQRRILDWFDKHVKGSK
jgi:dipeptidyl aminopeptidase/acylaminoacyl peptidase